MDAGSAAAVPARLCGLRLRWTDRPIEADFRHWRAERAVPFVRAAMYGSALGWAGTAVISPWIGPHFSRLAIPAALVIAPLIGAVLLVTYGQRARRWSLQAAAVGNVVAGLTLVAILDLAGAGVDGQRYADISVGIVVVLVFFGCTIMRLPPGLATLTITPYVVLQQAFLLRAFEDAGRLIGFTTLLWFSVVSGLLLAAVLDRVSRETFRQERTIAAQQEVIEAERARAERLLTSILPAPIAEELKRRPETVAESYDAVTIVFVDIVGFTSLASTMSPSGVVELLNAVFSRLDAVVDAHGIEKIKTIGDAYMAVAGLPTPRQDHVEVAADVALAMRRELVAFGRDRGIPLEFRLGMHTGPVVAGVIGTAKFAYDLWGDTVNVAARMESHGVPGRIQVSDEVAARLRAGGYELRERGVVDLKGKGPTRTWFLEAGPRRAVGVPPTVERAEA